MFSKAHARLAVSLGYLRNLEVPMLKVEDMPMFDLKGARKLGHSFKGGALP